MLIKKHHDLPNAFYLSVGESMSAFDFLVFYSYHILSYSDNLYLNRSLGTEIFLL